MNLVFLPATAPGDTTYGAIPRQIAAYPVATIHEVRFPKMVWYNEPVCQQAVEQIRSFDANPFTLIGFSKSGLGAWHLARMAPELVTHTIIFDAPTARHTLPSWNTELFYKNDKAWQADLPLLTIDRFKAAVPATHQLILISGANFHDEMCTFSQALVEANVEHVLLSRPHLKHHWNSGWIEEGLRACR